MRVQVRVHTHTPKSQTAPARRQILPATRKPSSRGGLQLRRGFESNVGPTELSRLRSTSQNVGARWDLNVSVWHTYTEKLQLVWNSRNGVLRTLAGSRPGRKKDSTPVPPRLFQAKARCGWRNGHKYIRGITWFSSNNMQFRSDPLALQV